MSAPGTGTDAPRIPDLPPGRMLDLPGRGTTFVREVAGPPGAPVVLLLHGWTVNADVNWFTSYGPLGRSYRVVALDLRGHGRGIRPRNGRVTLEDAADDAAAVCEALGIERMVVAGYSLGGAVAQLVWRRSPALVSGLVLCSTAGCFLAGGRQRQGSELWFRSQGAAARLLRATPAASQWVMARSVNGKVDRGPYADWIRGELLRGDPALLLSVGSAIGRFDSSTWLPEVDVPTSVVVTTHDRTISPSRQEALARAIPGARVWRVEGPHNASVTAARAWVPAFCAAVDHAAAGNRP